MLFRAKRHHVEGKQVGIKWLKEEMKEVWSQDAEGLRGPQYPPNSSGHANFVLQAGPRTAARGGGGATTLTTCLSVPPS